MCGVGLGHPGLLHRPGSIQEPRATEVPRAGHRPQQPFGADAGVTRPQERAHSIEQLRLIHAPRLPRVARSVKNFYTE